MGQEQSTNAPIDATGTRDRANRGIQVVEGSGTAVSDETQGNEVGQLLEQSSTTPVPQPLLPPSTIEDTVTSALQGAKMMHELKSLLGGFLLSPDEGPPIIPGGPASEGRNRTTDEPEHEKREERNGSQSVISSTAMDKRREEEQDAWAQVGVDALALDKIISGCTGGERMSNLVARQAGILEKIKLIGTMTARLKSAIDKNAEQARKTTKAMEVLDRLSMSVSDLHESLEQAVATANILGVAHFAEVNDMCSFKAFLKQNPPAV